MKANVTISPYIEGRYNNTKLEKLKAELDKLFAKQTTRENQSYPEEGVTVRISMSAKYQTPHVICENWGEYQSVGEWEEVIKEALENRGFEASETEWDEEYFRITFE